MSRLERRPSGRWLLRRVGRKRELEVEAFGIRFPNPIGLAAGMDKAAEALLAWQEIGFGWSEFGGITGEPQEGNPRPRMFRSGQDRALVNRMGFNNIGCDAAAERLWGRRESGLWPRIPIAANLGRSRIVTNDRASEDYRRSLSALWGHADMFVVNISSPNTPDLRDLQEDGALPELLTALREEADLLSQVDGSKPLLVKIAPDLTDDQIRAVCDTVLQSRFDGIVATNTSLSRPEASGSRSARILAEKGGLSGRPLRQRANEVCRVIHNHTAGSLTVVGVGGIDSPAAAWERIASGATLLQIYTGLVFEGADLPGRIIDDLYRQLAIRGFANLSEAVGCEAS